MIPDPTAVKPDDWDDDIDGEWEAPLINNPACESSAGCGPWSQPMIDNPAYKGKWYPALINNPNYKGKWRPRKIPNPDYYHDPEPFKMTAIGAVGIELWSMSDDIYFDNILITDKIEIADNWAKDTFDLKVQKLDVSEAGTIRRIINYSNRWDFNILSCPCVSGILCWMPSKTSNDVICPCVSGILGCTPSTSSSFSCLWS